MIPCSQQGGGGCHCWLILFHFSIVIGPISTSITAWLVGTSKHVKWLAPRKERVTSSIPVLYLSYGTATHFLPLSQNGLSHG
jgi:hypothetical protein